MLRPHHRLVARTVAAHIASFERPGLRDKFGKSTRSGEVNGVVRRRSEERKLRE